MSSLREWISDNNIVNYFEHWEIFTKSEEKPAVWQIALEEIDKLVMDRQVSISFFYLGV